MAKIYSEQEQDAVRNVVRDAIRKEAGDMPLCLYWCWSPAGLRTLEGIGHPNAVCFTNIGMDIALVVYLGDDFKPRVEKVQ